MATASSMVSAQLAAHPASASLLNLRGVVHAQRGELSDARQDFEQATRLSPALTPAWQNLARACQLQAEADQSALPCAIAGVAARLDPKTGRF